MFAVQSWRHARTPQSKRRHICARNNLYLPIDALRIYFKNMRKYSTALLIAIIFIQAACVRQTNVPPAGSYSNILLVTETGKLEGIAVDMVRELQHVRDYYTKEELQFRVRLVSAYQMQKEPPSKNMVILGLARQGEVGELIENIIGTNSVRKVLKGYNHVFKKLNYPVEGQLTVIVSAASGDKLQQVVRGNGEIIRNLFEEGNRERLRGYFELREKPEISAEIEARYGFHIMVPYDYTINQERDDIPGIELVNTKPHRGLAVSWHEWNDGPISLADSSTLYDARKDLAWRMYDKDVMRRDMVFFGEEKLGPFQAIRMEGYWENSVDTYGGPFICFFVYDEFDRRLWIVDCVVYAPGFPKHPNLRELHALAETFRLK